MRYVYTIKFWEITSLAKKRTTESRLGEGEMKNFLKAKKIYLVDKIKMHGSWVGEWVRVLPIYYYLDMRIYIFGTKWDHYIFQFSISKQRYHNWSNPNTPNEMKI